MPVEEAIAVVSSVTGCAPGNVPDGIITTVIRVCEACVKRSGTALHVSTVGTEPPIFEPLPAS
jgi:hypothetical protein